MTDVGVDLPAIRARCEAATEGPWSCRHADETDSGSWLIQAGDTSIEASIGDIWEGECDPRPNAEFIAHARSDIPALLALVATLTEERGTMAAHGIDWIHKAEAAESEVERLRGLVADLREYGQHKANCKISQWERGCERYPGIYKKQPKPDCTCRLADLLARSAIGEKE